MGEAVDRLVALARVKGYVRHQAGKLVRVKPYENSRHFLVTRDTEGTPVYEPHVVRNYPKDYVEKFPKFKKGVRQLGEHQPLRETVGAGLHTGRPEQDYSDSEALPGRAMRRVLAKHAKSKGSVYDQPGPSKRPTNAPDNWGAPKIKVNPDQPGPSKRPTNAPDNFGAPPKVAEQVQSGHSPVSRAMGYIMKNGLLDPGAEDATEPYIKGRTIDWHAKQAGVSIEDLNEAFRRLREKG